MEARTMKAEKPSQGAWRFALPWARSSPRLGEPTGRPKPRKSRLVRVVTEPPRMKGMKVRVATMALGRMWRNMILLSRTPNAFEARTYSKLRPRRNSALTTPTRPIQAKRRVIPRSHQKLGCTTLARMMKDGSAEARRQQSRIYTLLIAGISILALGIVLFAPIAIILLTAPKYHEAMYIVPILVLAWTFQGFYWIASNRVFYLGGGLWLATATVSSLGVGIALGFLLMPPYGMYGAAMAMVGTFVVRTMVILVIGERMYPVPWQLWGIIKAVAGIAVLGGLDMWLSPYLGLGASIALKTTLFVLTIPTVCLAGVISTSELSYGCGLVAGKIRNVFGRIK